MTPQHEYKLDKCLEKLHEIDMKVVGLAVLVERMENAEDRIEKLERSNFRITILLSVLLSAIAAHYGLELLKILRVIL